MDNKSPDAFRTISEVADWLGVPTHVLRFWESRFTQVKPVKRAGGRRYYRPSDMELLGGIRKLLHDDGLTIRGVQKLLREQGVKHVAAMSPPVDMDAVAESNVVSLAESRRAAQTDEAGTGARTPSDEPADDDAADDNVFATEVTDELESAPEPVDVAIEAQDVAQTTPAAGEELEDLTPVSYETVDEAEADEAPMGLAVDDLGTLDADDTTGRAVEEMTDFNPFAAAASSAGDDIPEGTDDDTPLAVEDDAGLAALVSDSLQDDAPDWSGQDLADPAFDEAEATTSWSDDADSATGEEASKLPPLETEAEADSAAMSTLDGLPEADPDLLPPAEPDDLPDLADDSSPDLSALDLDESATGTPADVPSDAEPTTVFDAAHSTPVTTDSDPTLDPVDTEDDDSLVATPPDFASQTDDDPVAVDAAVHAVLGDEVSVDDADAQAINPPGSDAEPFASPGPALIMPDIGPDPVDGDDTLLTPVATRLRALRAAGKPLPTAALSAFSARLATLRANAHKGSGPATRL